MDSPTLEPTIAGRVARGLAAASIAAYLVAAVLFTLPVETPGVQDCGAPAAYLVDGRVDTIPDPEGRVRVEDADAPDGFEVVTLDPEVAETAREEPCQERVASRAVPAGILVVVATVVGLAAFLLELLLVRPRRRAALRRELARQVAVPTP